MLKKNIHRTNTKHNIIYTNFMEMNKLFDKFCALFFISFIN